jgi:hypothetical protein
MRPNNPGEFMRHGPVHNKPHIIMENGKWRECTYSKLRSEAPAAIRRRWNKAQDWCMEKNWGTT